jgi:hypothetical protein
LAKTFFNVEFDAQNNRYVHLGPGRYIIKYACKPQMSPLEFFVESNPDSLNEVWDKFSELKVIYQGGINQGYPAEELLHQITEHLIYFLNLPEGDRFRKEALRTGLVSFYTYRESWLPEDSTFCSELLTSFASEPAVVPDEVLARAANTIFFNLKGDEFITRITEYAESLYDPDAIEALEEIINSIRDHDQQE